jgi:tRNA U34 5-methylaminomethyl-2-thiouridine-forming methyltransferase MnmC
LNQLFRTEDGSHTIFVPEMNEHYHSIHGAVQESMHIFINSGFNFCTSDPLDIFEVGFGTGLNALLTAVESKKSNRIINYSAIEKYPVETNLLNKLNYSHFAGDSGKEIFPNIHSAEWGCKTQITENFYLNKIKGDLTVSIPEGNFNLIYFDAFGPDKQPEMWSKDIFEMISSMTMKAGVLVTYSAKGEVKRNLKACGFEVTLLPGPPGKRQIIRAIKI